MAGFRNRSLLHSPVQILSVYFKPLHCLWLWEYTNKTGPSLEGANREGILITSAQNTLAVLWTEWRGEDWAGEQLTWRLWEDDIRSGSFSLSSRFLGAEKRRTEHCRQSERFCCGISLQLRERTCGGQQDGENGGQWGKRREHWTGEALDILKCCWFWSWNFKEANFESSGKS